MARTDPSSSGRPDRRPRRGSGSSGSGPGRAGGGGPRQGGPSGRPPGRPLGGPGGDAAAGRAPARTVVYGRNAVREAVRGPRRVHRVWATRGAVAEANWPGVELLAADADELTERCGTDGHQGICAEVELYRYADAATLLRRPAPVIIALDEVTDPQNLGAVCRSAECAGATGVVIPERRSAEVTPAVCKASAGAVEHLPIARVRNLADFLGEAKGANCWCYGAAAGAPMAYDEPDWSGGVVVVLGAEGRGLRPRVAASCDALISLPIQGRIDSLNVSAAAAVVLYEILQQRSGG